jgi:hypothetical protein
VCLTASIQRMDALKDGHDGRGMDARWTGGWTEQMHRYVVEMPAKLTREQWTAKEPLEG